MSISLTPRRRLATGGLIVAALAVLAAASVVVWQRGDDNGSTAQTAGSGPTTTLDPNAPPALNTTGEDWDGIVRSILGYQAWLFTHPRPELLDNIFLPSYSAYADSKLGLTNLATKGWRYDPEFRPGTLQVVRLFDRPQADVAVVFVRSFDPPNKVIDPSGNVVLDSPGAGDTSVLWTLRRTSTSDAQWKVDKVTPFTGTPPKS